MRVEFKLVLYGPRNIGQDKNFIICTDVYAKKITDFGITTGKTWSYNWPDGWVAIITARIMDKYERQTKSDGFYGYGWMVDSILCNNEILKPAR